ncbi:MAG: alanine/ornithine racemase family PLP-dependent enzyme [Negativicutes bacterium]|jgi:predicted amino acid racemase
MLSNPCLIINLRKIGENCKLLQDNCQKRGISIVGVTKAFDGEPRLANVYVNSGITVLGDSRLDNIARMRAANIVAEYMLLRIPMASEVAALVATVDYCLISEPVTARLISEANAKNSIALKLILMIDLGDLREGVLPENALSIAKLIDQLEHVELVGIGANFACFGGVAPTGAKLLQLLELKTAIESQLNKQLTIVSGGNSANVNLLFNDGIPDGINQLRLGECLLLGKETLTRQAIPGANIDAVTLRAEIVELIRKPSLPYGEIAQDAFGQVPHFADRGVRRRAICAIGKLDIDVEGLQPRVPGVEVLGGSSDHLICDVEAVPYLKLGDTVDFSVSYAAFIYAMLSPYVAKYYIEQ